MRLAEAFGLSDVFIPGLRFRTHVIADPHDPDGLYAWNGGSSFRLSLPRKKEFAEAMQIFCRERYRFIARHPIYPFDLFVSVIAEHVSLGRGLCPALADKACSIYESRPSVCKTVPLDGTVPEAFQGEALAFFQGYITSAEDGECDFGTPAPLMFDGTRIAAEADRKAWLQTTAKCDVAEQLIDSHLIDTMDMTPEKLWNASESGFPQVTDFSPAVKYLSNGNAQISEVFYRNQLAMIDRELAAAGENMGTASLRQLTSFRARYANILHEKDGT